MKKKIIKRIIITFIFLFPIFINADTYNYIGAKVVGNNYLNKNIYINRNKYLIISNNIKFSFDDNGKLSVNSDFYNAGFLNSKEYCLSVGKNNCKGNSYLLITTPYWTMTKDGNNVYYVSNISGLSSKNENDSLSVRVTEFAKPNVEVTGEGTFSNPWEFSMEPLVKLTTNGIAYSYFNNDANEKKRSLEEYAKVRYNGDKKENYLDFEMIVTHGYENNPNDGCNLNLVNEERINNGTTTPPSKKSYEIKNIKSDINCLSVFRKKTFDIVFDCNGGGNMSGQQIVYNDVLNLKSNECVRKGYTFEGWTDPEGNIWPNAWTGKFEYDDGDKGISNKTLTLKAIWKEKVITVTFHKNYGDYATHVERYYFTRTGQKLYGGWGRSSHTALGWATSASSSAKWSMTNAVSGDWIDVNYPSIDLFEQYRYNPPPPPPAPSGGLSNWWVLPQAHCHGCKW